MPKINVYLPDELAEAVKDTGVPVSAVCQRALEQAVRRVTAVRETALRDLTVADVAELLPQFTGRAQTVLTMATERAVAAATAEVTTAHLLAAMIAEGGNLALHVLRAIDVDLAQVQRDLARQSVAEVGVGRGAGAQAGTWRFSPPAAAALQAAVTEATSLGHNYIGCEHLLLGFVAESDGVAGQVLRTAGAEVRLTRRAVAAALAGYVHLRAQTSAEPAPATVVQQALEPLVARLERLERQVAAGSDRAER